MEIGLETDGPVALLRVTGEAGVRDGDALSSYLRVARENGAVRVIVDLSSCPSVATTVVSRFLKERGLFREAGGALSFCGVAAQNPFLARAVSEGTLAHHASAAEGVEAERRAAGC